MSRFVTFYWIQQGRVTERDMESAAVLGLDTPFVVSAPAEWAQLGVMTALGFKVLLQRG